LYSFKLSTPGNPYQTSFLPNHTFFNQTNQDFLLISLSSIALYTAPVFDDWFYATTEETETASLAFPYENAYYQNSWTSIMACTERHQFCNPNLGTGSPASCTSFNGSNALFFDDLLQNNGSNIHLNNRQWATTFRLLMTLDQSAISSVLDILDTTTLDAEAYLFGESEFENDFSQPLPNDQWQIEVINWHNITMANMQRWALLYAQNGNGPEDVPFIQPPTTPEGKDMCSNQRYRLTGVMSFSGLGVVVVLGLGSLIILANLFLPSIVGFFQTGKYHQKQWAFDETIQLQRMAFEGAGQGTWRNKESQIPLTEKGEKFCHVARFSSGLEADYHYLDTKPQADIGIAI
jgi:hypothetical protein